MLAFGEKSHSAGLVLLLCSSVLYWRGLLVQADEEEAPLSMDEAVEMMQPFAENCDVKPEREHMVEVLENREDAQMDSKCFRHCMMQQFDLMPKDALQVSEDQTVSIMNILFPDRDDDSRRITVACNQEQTSSGLTDKCEVAHSLAMCMLRQMRESGYNIPELKQ